MADKEPVEAWLRQARAQQEVMRRQKLAVEELSNKLEERRLVEQAKGRLMKVQGMDEETAYKAMRTLAMRNSQSLADVARRILITLSE